MTTTLSEQDLPGFWQAADAASRRGQLAVLWLTGTRIAGLLVAAGFGLVLPLPDRPAAASVLVVIGFATVLSVEVLSWVLQPERTWYSGRALAESAKTLAWRFAVGGGPFDINLQTTEATKILTTRLEEVSREAKDKLTVPPDQAVTTAQMLTIRALSFEARKEAYLDGRVIEQNGWYARKASACRTNATRWRIALIVGEIGAVVLSISQVLNPWPVGIAGLIATLIACASAWIAVKQYSTLASAYSVTAAELALLTPRVRDAAESSWGELVDDAEEAISREHTLWLASRTGRAPLPTRRVDVS